MITPELIEYIRGEFATGRTREQIRAGLVADGGWSESDLSEAFRKVIPMQGLGESPVVVQGSFSVSPSPSIFSSSLLRKILLFALIVTIFFAIWFYRAPLLSFWSNLGVDKIKETVNTETVVPTGNVGIKDCGVGVAPDLKHPLTYESDVVLNCLGNSALRCEDAKAVLSDALFPTIFQIIKNNDTTDQSCNFKLSYGPDSTLVDATGRKLAGQYISCPLPIVKAIDETINTPSFKAPSLDNLGKYASQIYFYGTLGVFIEQGVDKTKIQSLGCSGPYIDTVIASYNRR